MADKDADKQRDITESRKRSLANLKPPWPKGTSGNPAGRPKTITLSEAYRNALAQPVPNDPENRTFAEVIARSMVIAAAKGDVSSAKELADRVEGKARQALDINANLLDWREMARAHGLNEADVIAEARLLIESAAESGGDGSNRAPSPG
jgi:Family of unknown function (DUF5681)